LGQKNLPLFGNGEWGIGNGHKLLAVGRKEKDTQPEQEKPDLASSIGMLIADGFLLSMALISWAWSLTQTSIANSSVMHNLTPIFTVH